MLIFFKKIFLPFQFAWQSLWRHKGRTVLTVIGIIIGIAAVIIVMSAGESLKALVLGQLDSFGSNYIQIEVKVPATAKNSSDNALAMGQGVQITTLKTKDAEAIGRLPNIKNYNAAVFGQAVVSYLDQNKAINFYGALPEIINIDTMKINQGRFYTEEENKGLAKVTVIGKNVADKLFGNQDPIGARIKVGREYFTVIGTLQERGGGFGISFDDFIYVPLETAQKLLMGIDYVSFITAQVKNPAIQDQTADDITYLLRERHQITDPKDDDFSVTTQAEAREMIDTIFGGITLLLVAIAGISLLVGGIGIMNIMYVSVTERTFEIGLRKAVGARPRQILWQFLWEAIMVTLFGGVIGILGGMVFTYLVSFVAGLLGFSWQFVLAPSSIVIAFSFCVLVGLIFGYYPARKAAKLNPVQALGHE